MQVFLQFVIQNWILWTLFFAILALVVWYEMRPTVGGVTKIDPQGLVHLINRENATVIDVRDPEAFKQGHIVGSVNIPANQLSQKQKKLQRAKGKPIAMICGAGQASLKAAIELRKQGFENIYCLNGGLTAWKNASLPVEK